MYRKELTLKRGLLYLLAKYGIAAVVTFPTATTLGAIMMPICLAAAKTKPGKVLSALGVIVAGSLTSTAIGLAVSDKIMKQFCPATQKEFDEFMEDGSI